MPRLIVQITVDQLRTDLLTRFSERFGQGGLRRFLEQGLLYDNARYAHAITETAVGHATLFTGALPSTHGIVGNEWLEAGRKRTSVEDARFPWVGNVSRPGRGSAPTALRVATLGDELKLGSDGAAQIFAVSLKDRAAILPAGFAGKAFWYDDGSGQFVTSSYYYPALPKWAESYAQAHPLDRYPAQWELLNARESYTRRDRDKRPFEKPMQGESSFPHRLTGEDVKTRARALKHSPFGDELILDFSAALLDAESLGRDAVPDLLAISFSATDIVGHAFGPESLEAEDNLLRLDRVIARLFELLLSRMQSSELLVVLSADHGISETPEHLASLGLPAGRHPAGKALVAELNAQLVARFGPQGDFVLGFANPCLWLDEAKALALKISVEEAERIVAQLVLARPGMVRAFTRSELSGNQLPGDEFALLAQRSFDRERTGHVHIVPAPGWILATDPEDLAAMHGTPYNYDRSVPIALWGAEIAAQVVHRPVDPRDIAPTLALFAGVKVPEGSSGQVLWEAFAAP